MVRNTYLRTRHWTCGVVFVCQKYCQLFLGQASRRSHNNAQCVALFNMPISLPLSMLWNAQTMVFLSHSTQLFIFSKMCCLFYLTQPMVKDLRDWCSTLIVNILHQCVSDALVFEQILFHGLCESATQITKNQRFSISSWVHLVRCWSTHWFIILALVYFQLVLLPMSFNDL